MNKELAHRLTPVASASTLQLTHYGRKSGKPYEVTIWFMVEGAPFQDERQAFIGKFNALFPASDINFYFRAGLTLKF